MTNKPNFSDEAMERQARAHLAAHRWRKARDELKILSKKDRAKYQPLLIEANIGLAREMMEKGMVSEAQQVIAYLKTIAPADIVKSLELQAASRSGDKEKSFSGALGLLTASRDGLPKEDQLRLADQLVLAFAPIRSQTPEEAAVVAEANAIQGAIQAISDGQIERAQDIIRPLARDSAFSHWKLWIKGLAAFHRGENDKAARSFEEIPPKSVPGRARMAYLLLLDKASGDSSPAEPVIKAVAHLAGSPEAAPWLGRAEALWRQGKAVDSYKTVRDAWALFPSEALTLPGVLTEFYFNSIFTLNERAKEACEDFFLPLEDDNRVKSQVESKFIKRTFCLLFSLQLEPSLLKTKWEAFLGIHEQQHGANPCLASLAYYWLGEVFSMAHSRSFDPGGKKRVLRAPDDAIEVLQKSIALDPQNVAAHILLWAVYDATGKTKERNRLLDTMAERFPDNKEVLVRAGTSCLERKAFNKGIEYLERALALDRIDPTIPNAIVSGNLMLSFQHFQKGRLEDARQTFDRANVFAMETPENFFRNPWGLLTRRGLLELRFGDKSRGEELLAQARSKSPFSIAFLFFGQMAWRHYDPLKGQASPFEPELKQAKPDAAQAATLVRIWQYWNATPEKNPAPLEKPWLQKMLKNAAKSPFTRNEAKQLVDLLKDEQDFLDNCRPFVSAILKNDPKDPLFRLYDYVIESDSPKSSNSLKPFDFDSKEQQLQFILEEAKRRRDEEAIKFARELLADLKALPDPFDATDDDEDYDIPDYEFADDPGSSDPPPEVLEVFAGFVDMLSMASDREIEQMRKTRPKDIPAELFETLVKMSRTYKLKPPKSASPKKAPDGSTDPNSTQMDLF